jgi:ribose/xylose/arabinose/galactoside ABC-type transport system permease subunit
MPALAATRDLFRRIYGSDAFVAVLCLAWVGATAPFAPDLLSPGNLLNLLINLLPLLILAVGQTLVLIAGGIDLSVTAVIGLAGVTGAFLMNGETGWLAGSGLAPAAGIALMLACGAAVGFANGVAVGVLRMPAFMVTLTSMMFLSGLAVWLTESRAIGNLPAGFIRFGGGTASAVVLTAATALAAHALLTRTVFGRHVFALGHNPRVALIAGVPVTRVWILIYVLSGVCAALAAVLYTGRLETASPVTGQRVLLDVIGATVIGGASLYGGRGRIVGTALGALFLTIIDNSLNLLNLSHFTIMMVKGGVILAAAGLDARRHRSRSA